MNSASVSSLEEYCHLAEGFVVLVREQALDQLDSKRLVEVLESTLSHLLHVCGGKLCFVGL
jgi:hypothetical protein